MRRRTPVLRAWMIALGLGFWASFAQAAEPGAAAHGPTPPKVDAPKPPAAPHVPGAPESGKAPATTRDEASKAAAPEAPAKAENPPGAAHPEGSDAHAKPEGEGKGPAPAPHEGGPETPGDGAIKARTDHASSPPRSRKRPPRRSQREPTPRSLTLDALKEEIANSPAEIEKNNLLKEREHIGELAGALDQAQKTLRADAERLASFLEEVKKQTQDIKTSQEQAQKAAEEAAAQEKAAAEAAQGNPGPTPLEVLAKAMRGMKAAQAAAIAERLPVALAADVFERMPARDAGKVMGLMNPDAAAVLAGEIAARDESRKKTKK